MRKSVSTRAVNMMLLATIIIMPLAGCASDPIVRTEYVDRPVTVRLSIPGGALAPCVYDRPAKGCGEYYCNGQLATMVIEYTRALSICNSQIDAMRRIND